MTTNITGQNAISTGTLYEKSNILRLKELGKIAPETFKAFVAFDTLALAPGVISKKTRNLLQSLSPTLPAARIVLKAM